jgi:hypothetical protein
MERIGRRNRQGEGSPFAASAAIALAVAFTALFAVSRSASVAEARGGALRLIAEATPSHASVGEAVTVHISHIRLPSHDRVRSISVSWGDGTSPVRVRHHTARHVYRLAGIHIVVVRFTDARGKTAVTRLRVKVSSASSAKPAITVAPGIALVDLGSNGLPFPGESVSLPDMSADGQHVAWEYDVGSGKSYGMVWRDLNTGRTVVKPSLYPYALDMSANGEFVAYATESAGASNGFVTAMTVWLWNTRTGKRIAISRTPSGAIATDGKTSGLSISEDGRWVVFDSTSQQMAPQGVTTCPECIESSGYIYLYDQLTETLHPVPDQPSFGSQPFLRYPVISGDGGTVAFHSGLATDLWYPASDVTREIEPSEEIAASDFKTLALSQDGKTLANNTGSGISVLHLGGAAGPDSLEWSRPEPTGGIPEGVALSASGTTVSFIGEYEGTRGHLLRTTLPQGTVTSVPIPPAFPGVWPATAPITSGGPLGRVTTTPDGSMIASVLCTAGTPPVCHLFRWKL